jgi:hypothetical protein
MNRILFALSLMLIVAWAHASGPVASHGWDGSFEPKLPNGEPCCIPADLNGTKLVGGAFLLISSGKKEFGLFALTYTPPFKAHWQLLEKHPISLLPAFRFSVEQSEHSHAAIKACKAPDNCTYYVAPASGLSGLKRANNSFTK